MDKLFKKSWIIVMLTEKFEKFLLATQHQILIEKFSNFFSKSSTKKKKHYKSIAKWLSICKHRGFNPVS